MALFPHTPFRPRLLAASLFALVLALILTPIVAMPAQETAQDKLLDVIQDQASRLRELRPLGNVSRTFMPRDQLRAHYEQMFFEETPVEDIENSQTFLEVLGYIDPGVDIINILLDVFGEEVLGFYDRNENSIYVVLDQQELQPEDLVTLAHEFTHALQDEHFDLKTGFLDRKDNNDRTLAYQALVEGDAVLVQVLYSYRYLTDEERDEVFGAADGSGGSSVSPPKAVDTAPLILRRELYFPYEEGANFLVQPYLNGGWDAIDAIWANPPESTEQILHPEKYAAKEAPIAVELPDLAAATGPDWRLLTEDTLGELDWRILFEQYLGLPRAETAAAGWGGDRFQLVKRDSDGAVAFEGKTVWDTEADAAEFYDAYIAVVEARHAAAGLEQLDPAAFAPAGSAVSAAWGARSGKWNHAVTRNGATVSIVTATSPDPLPTLGALQ